MGIRLVRIVTNHLQDQRTPDISSVIQEIVNRSGWTQSNSLAIIISGTGDVIEPDDGLAAIGSGGPYALAAARAMLKHADLSAREITEEAMRIAADICIYTNEYILIEEIT